jgi:Glycosyltransferase family 87
MPRKPSRQSDQRLLLGVLALCILVSYATLFYIKRDGLPYRDFKIFYTGARMVWEGQRAQLYDLNLQSRIQQDLLHIRAEETLPYNHPPFELILFLPVSGSSYSTAFYFWLLFSLALGLGSASLMSAELRQLRAVWASLPHALVLCLFPFFMVLLEGQDSAVALFLLVAAWVSLRHGRDAQTGFWLGLALFKFQIFLPLTFLLALRRPKLLKGFAVSAALLGIVSIVMIGWDGVIAYVYSLTHMARASSEGVSLQYGMDPRLIPNLRGLAYGIFSQGRASLSPAATTALLVTVALGSLVFLGWTARRIFRMTAAVDSPANSPADSDLARASEGAGILDLAFALAVIASLLLSFHILAHDLALLALPFAIIIARIRMPGLYSAARRGAFIALISIFYVYVAYLFLFANSLVFLLSLVLIALVYLISAEGRAPVPDPV